MSENEINEELIEYLPKYEIKAYINKLKDKIYQLEQQVAEYEDLLDIMNNRKWRKKFNKEIWEKELGHKLSTPDFDFVYKLFFEQRKELKQLKGE